MAKESNSSAQTVLMERDYFSYVISFLLIRLVWFDPFLSFASNENVALLQFGETVLSRRSGRGVLGCLVDDFESGSGTLTEN